MDVDDVIVEGLLPFHVRVSIKLYFRNSQQFPTSMAGGEVDSLTSLLSETSVDGKNGLSFAGRGIKMNDEETGER